MMSILCTLPCELLSSIIYEWIDSPKDIIALDIAVANRLLRIHYLSSVQMKKSGEGLKIYDVEIPSLSKLLKLANWKSNRKCEISSMHVSSHSSSLCGGQLERMLLLDFKNLTRLLITGKECFDLSTIFFSMKYLKVFHLRIPENHIICNKATLYRFEETAIEILTLTHDKFACCDDCGTPSLNVIYKWIARCCPHLKKLFLKNDIPRIGYKAIYDMLFALKNLQDFTHYFLGLVFQTSDTVVDQPVGKFMKLKNLCGFISNLTNIEIPVEVDDFLYLLHYCPSLTHLGLDCVFCHSRDLPSVAILETWLQEHGRQVEHIELRNTSRIFLQSPVLLELISEYCDSLRTFIVKDIYRLPEHFFHDSQFGMTLDTLTMYIKLFSQNDCEELCSGRFPALTKLTMGSKMSVPTTLHFLSQVFTSFPRLMELNCCIFSVGSEHQAKQILVLIGRLFSNPQATRIKVLDITLTGAIDTVALTENMIEWFYKRSFPNLRKLTFVCSELNGTTVDFANFAIILERLLRACPKLALLKIELGPFYNIRKNTIWQLDLLRAALRGE